MDFNVVATQFVEYYYKAFDDNRAQLAVLYRPNSMLTFETNQVQGATAIGEKLISLPFAKVQHKISTLDAQPSGPGGGIMVLVTGQLLVDDQAHPMNYTQCFQLLPEEASYYVFNDIFKLIYG